MDLYYQNLFGFLFKVLEAVTLIDVRRHFVDALALLFGRPLEADPVRIQAVYIFAK